MTSLCPLDPDSQPVDAGNARVLQYTGALENDTLLKMHDCDCSIVQTALGIKITTLQAKVLLGKWQLKTTNTGCR